jgi:hypothetical protein
MLERFLSSTDLGRAQRVIQKLARHDIHPWILTGGLAVEIHHIMHGAVPIRRTLGDIDFVVASFDCLPKDLQNSFLFRHVHPLDPPGKIILQAIDKDEALRVDVFNDGGTAIRRANNVTLHGWTTRIISVEDLLARMARLTLDIAHGEAVPAKHARDFLRLLGLADLASVETIWPYHRRPDHPATFQEASERLQDLIPKRQALLINPSYSNDINEICKRCIPTPEFQVADLKRLYSILGYV